MNREGVGAIAEIAGIGKAKPYRGLTRMTRIRNRGQAEVYAN
jgi:hypothetical protein